VRGTSGVVMVLALFTFFFGIYSCAQCEVASHLIWKEDSIKMTMKLNTRILEKYL
jgi:hypothetical protein